VTTGEPGELSPVLTGLPVGGFSGTLSERYRTGPQAAGAGVVRAKTGTLRGVSALAGVVRTAEGRLLAFALTADAVPAGANRPAEAVLDRLAASFARCGCR
jgi:serine-type D-Ala-D-Ala carboxypeptidase/endopeptidase (penicillin-binding protein 4)